MMEPPVDRPDLAGPRVGADVPRDPPGERPSKRLLAQAPADRIASRARGSPVGAGLAETRGSTTRALAYGLALGAAGVAAHVAGATWLLWSGALLVVAVTLGIAVGLGVALGAGRALGPRARRSMALGLAIGALAVAIAVNWFLSGMYLGPLDYLAQVYGFLVPLQVLLAGAGALAAAGTIPGSS